LSSKPPVPASTSPGWNRGEQVLHHIRTQNMAQIGLYLNEITQSLKGGK
jgi:hypothetical protein